jgi:DNA polymerase elongation subunit (family B)
MVSVGADIIRPYSTTNVSVLPFSSPMPISCSFPHTLFLDIECVPTEASFFDLDESMQALREKKWSKMLTNMWLEDELSVSDLYEQRSGIFAEFGKIIVISTWILTKTEDGSYQMRVKSFAGDDERKLLVDFFDLLNSYYTKPQHALCGHNIKEFDIPYICRRATIHGLELPNILDIQGKKPRETNHLDTLELWKFGDRKNFTSLDLLCRVLGVQTPKTDISGEQVARVYRDEKNLPRITEYCERDVVAVGDVMLKFLRVDATVEQVEKV